MRVREVLEAQLAILAADSALTTLLGGEHIYMRDSVDEVEQVPGIYWWGPDEAPMEEVTHRAMVLWDVWADTSEQALAIETRLRDLLHHETPRQYGDVLAWSSFAGSSVLAAAKGQARRAAEFEIQPVRRRPRAA